MVMAVEEEMVDDMEEEEEAAVVNQVVIDVAIKIEREITQTKRPLSYAMVLTSTITRVTTLLRRKCVR